MARPRKAVPKAAAADPTPEPVQAKNEPVNVGSLLVEFEKMVKEKEDLRKEVEALRSAAGIQDPTDGGRRVVTGKADELTLKKPLPATAKTETYAVFRSPFPGFKQVIRKSKRHAFADGEYYIEPPVVAEFTRGVCVLYDTELIDMMREKMEEKERKGEADFIEVTDSKLKDEVIAGTRSVQSPEVTVDTPAESLI